MKVIQTQQGHTSWSVSQPRNLSYQVIECENIFDPANPALLLGGDSQRRLVVVDTVVQELYGQALATYFDHHKIRAHFIPFQSDEKRKSATCFFELAAAMDEFGVHRRSEPIIAIGGGVVTDLVGFVASCYRRGIPHLKVPTTLMGYVDASVGIKTAINFNGAKNRLGSFEPPLAVLLSQQFLDSLPKRHLLNGMGEIMKLAVIKDRELFELLLNEGQEAVTKRFQACGQTILRRSISGMLEELEGNFFETNLERSVDFGHTFSPLLEMLHLDGLLHGEAVAIDVAYSTVLAAGRGWLSQPECRQVLQAMERLELPVWHAGMTAQMLWESLAERVCHRDGQQNVPLPEGIGRCRFANDLTLDELDKACRYLEQNYGGTGQANSAQFVPSNGGGNPC